ncbi:hypothetical protein [Desulfovibrio sp. DV]|uniref:hypothetical protein n=1 Tax=Desulfovibrio sp. DV TaxID=1844708 RepID=UPI0011150FE4|nr:hypothetical protein [Desulfovibrio sp. DV]
MSYDISKYERTIQEIADSSPYVVFLCGPSMKSYTKPSSSLRKLIKDELESESFEVVLGEDDGLVDLQTDLGGDAQTNELGFFINNANAIVLIADSPGSFAELGLFSHVHSALQKQVQFILIIDKSFESDECYISQGPIRIVDVHGKIFFIDYNENDPPIRTTIDKTIALLKAARFRTFLK